MLAIGMIGTSLLEELVEFFFPLFGGWSAADGLDGSYGVVGPTLPMVSAIAVERVVILVAIISLAFVLIGGKAFATTVVFLVVSVHPFGHHLTERLQVFGQ